MELRCWWAVFPEGVSSQCPIDCTWPWIARSAAHCKIVNVEVVKFLQLFLCLVVCSFINFKRIFILILYVCVRLCTMCVQCPRWPEEGTGCPLTGVTDDYALLYECWKLKPGPLEEQAVLSHLSSLDCSFFFLDCELCRWWYDDDVVVKWQKVGMLVSVWGECLPSYKWYQDLQFPVKHNTRESVSSWLPPSNSSEHCLPLTCPSTHTSFSDSHAPPPPL